MVAARLIGRSLPSTTLSLTSSTTSVWSLSSGASSNANKPYMRNAKIRVGGMTCSNCSSAVEKALGGIKGVERCEVDLINETAFISYQGDGKLTAKMLCDEIEDIGFEATLIEDISMAASAVLTRYAVIRVGGMTCSNCSSAIERLLNNLESVDRCNVDLINETASVWYQGSANSKSSSAKGVTANELCDSIEEIGFEATLVDDGEASTDAQDTEPDRATLDLTISGSDDKLLCCQGKFGIHPSEAAIDLLKLQKGVLEVADQDDLEHVKVTYDPSIVGARSLISILLNAGIKASQDHEADARKAAPTGWSSIQQGLPTSVALTIMIAVICEVLPSFGKCDVFLKYEICPGLPLPTLIVCILAAPVQIVCGRRFHVGAYHSIKTGVWDMNVLISLGTVLCFAYALIVVVLLVLGPHFLHKHCSPPPPSYFESPCLVITFILLGKSMENWARSGASESLRGLLSLKAPTAHLLIPNSVSQSKEVNLPTTNAVAETLPVQLLHLGDVIQVFPGETVPSDGVLASESGSACFDESLLTGESRPIEKKKGDFVVGGSKCVTGRAEIRIERLGSKTMLSQITALVQRAQLSRAPVQRIADSVAHSFVPFIVALAVITWIVWYFLVYTFKVVPVASIPKLHSSDWPELDRIFFVLEHGLTVLLVACPCALGLATPTAVMAATGVSAAHGILIRSGAVPLEIGSKVDRIVFDKTGTLTLGQPKVVQAAFTCPAAAKKQQKNIDDSSSEATVIGEGPGWQELLDAFRSSGAGVGLLANSFSEPSHQWVQSGGAAVDDSTSSDATSSTKSSPKMGPSRDESICLENAPEDDLEKNSSVSVSAGPLVLLPGSEAAAARAKLREEAEASLWWALGSAELSSEHPLAKEIVSVAGAKVRGLAKPESFENLTGVGIRCSLAGGLEVLVASASHVLRATDNGCNKCPEELAHWIETSRADGNTVVVVAVNGIPLGSVALKDSLAPHARASVAELQMAGIEVWMCTGDHRKAADAVAKECGIPSHRIVAEAFPVDKVRLVQSLQTLKQAEGEDEEQANEEDPALELNERPSIVAMVGDGINDAPALAAADLGIAIGAGQNVTVDAADIVLVRTDLRDLCTFFSLARQTLRTIYFNFLWAFIFNVCALPVAAGAFWPYGVLMTPQIACTLMLGSSLFVVISSLNLKRWAPTH
eukprot:TRINITY_DN10767_c0_g1_i1.p1 TRINITY_DN10767_c0_g1~~TRINITY_DN10767_c0_g1_i1.p1  ORF type:complete len:1176 (-),score=263.13 TRINITY_DN10767_c0_g1_i1:430-3957(-)